MQVARRHRREVADAAMVHVGRQEIYDRELGVVAYELLFRDLSTAESASGSGDSATSSVIVNTFSEFGFDELLGGKVGFLNLTRAFLVGELPLPFGPERVVLEVLETIELDQAVIEGVRRFAAEGYAIALDDFVWRPGVEELLATADYVKFDVLDADLAEVARTMERCRPFGVAFVAERIEDAAMLERCKELGFDLFQGYHLRRPEVLSIEVLSPDHASAVQLLGRLADSDVSIGDVEDLVRLDVALSYRLLRIANSAGAGLPRRVASIREALVMVGLGRLRAWLVLIALADATKSGDDRFGPIVARARACELVAEGTPNVRGDIAFTLGLLHGLSELFGVSRGELIDRLNLEGPLAESLRDLRSPLHAVLGAVLAHENLDDEALTESGFDAFDVSRAYLSALGWSLQICSAVSA